jgi:hypothetical protein
VLHPMTRAPTIHRAIVVLTLAARCVDPSEAAAEETSADAGDLSRKDKAREAYRLGTALAREGQWRDALAAFTRSASHYAHAATSFNVAFCERALGHYTRARRQFQLALAQHARSGALEPARAAQAERYLHELEKKIAHLRITITPGALVSVDAGPLARDRSAYVAGVAEGARGTRVESATLVVELDPGAHVLVAEGTNGQRLEIRVRVRQGGRRAVSLVFPAAPPQADHLGPWSAVIMGTGASGLVAGAAFGLAALEKRAVLEERCPEPTRCPPEHEGDIATLRRSARASTVALSVGGVLSAVGIALFVYGRVTRGASSSGEQHRVVLTTSGVQLAF